VTRFRTPQIVLFVVSPERTAAFYERLGFQEVFRTPATGEPVHVDLVLDGYRIGLAGVGSTRHDHGLSPVACGQRAAVVLWTDDIRAAWAALEEAGATPVKPPSVARPTADRVGGGPGRAPGPGGAVEPLLSCG
jgi:catechol 2,3-dioxygenase-like lactoylglutathione lyase family enzyme